MSAPTEPALAVRSDLAGLEPYSSPQRPARYRMNTNESPYEPSPAFRSELAGAISAVELNRYPDKDAHDLCEELSLHTAWPQEGISVANGSNEVLLHLCLAYAGTNRTVLTFEPTYSLHSLIPRMTGAEVVQLARDDIFEVDLDAAVTATRDLRPEIVMVCSPNNPTGVLEPLPSIEALLEEAPGIVIVDEAYSEFADPGDSARGLLEEHPNLVVTKTFSKAWQLAGARIGYALGHPALMEGLALVRLPYHLSALSQVTALVALRHADESMRLAAAVAEERDRIAIELQAMGVKTIPSHANFVLFEVDDPPGVWTRLLERDVLIRIYTGTPGLEHAVRVTAGRPHETEVFLAAMREILDE
ncbi:MAG: histidinol-phosphate transaminase [Actinobacteria bacterium]|nr:histidinol-phosphate transaminase [Actinomycetota bacterium]MDQ3532928.1 histidinol-phosphate transaminase [Actinomycetota bacterium]